LECQPYPKPGEGGGGAEFIAIEYQNNRRHAHLSKKLYSEGIRKGIKKYKKKE
jgi:hypothetical protein